MMCTTQNSHLVNTRQKNHYNHYHHRPNLSRDYFYFYQIKSSSLIFSITYLNNSFSFSIFLLLPCVVIHYHQHLFFFKNHLHRYYSTGQHGSINWYWRKTKLDQTTNEHVSFRANIKRIENFNDISLSLFNYPCFR